MMKWIWEWVREMKDQERFQGFWFEQLEKCNCHLLYGFIEWHLVCFMTLGKAMSEMEGTVHCGGHSASFQVWEGVMAW